MERTLLFQFWAKCITLEGNYIEKEEVDLNRNVKLSDRFLFCLGYIHSFANKRNLYKPELYNLIMFTGLRKILLFHNCNNFR